MDSKKRKIPIGQEIAICPLWADLRLTVVVVRFTFFSPSLGKY
jgi:hypothetical protein